MAIELFLFRLSLTFKLSKHIRTQQNMHTFDEQLKIKMDQRHLIQNFPEVLGRVSSFSTYVEFIMTFPH